jgi:hypothetical protein
VLGHPMEVHEPHGEGDRQDEQQGSPGCHSGAPRGETVLHGAASPDEFKTRAGMTTGDGRNAPAPAEQGTGTIGLEAKRCRPTVTEQV